MLISTLKSKTDRILIKITTEKPTSSLLIYPITSKEKLVDVDKIIKEMKEKGYVCAVDFDAMIVACYLPSSSE